MTSTSVSSITVSAPYPNPVSGSTVSFNVRSSGDATVKWNVHTVSFREVAGGQQAISGNATLIWDLEDRSGALIANGLYYIRVQVTGSSVSGTQVLKVLVLR